jgi:protein-S-isoprenylcysteine O-methyltransferase Ste14
MRTFLVAQVTGLIGIGAFGLLLFVPAGTLDYPQAWVFLAVYAVTSLVPGLWLSLRDPAALKRRMRVGPVVESRTVQKVVVTAVFLVTIGTLVVSGLDRRFGWSHVPMAVWITGDVLVAVGLGMAMLVVVQNRYAAATVTVEAGQTLVSTGLYGLVRHPMYVGALIMLVGFPLALGSYWALLLVLAGLPMLAVRIADEEKMLNEDLAGYREYTQRVRYRLVPHVW